MTKACSWKIILNINERNKKLETHSPSKEDLLVTGEIVPSQIVFRSGYAKLLVASLDIAHDIVSMMNNVTYFSEHEVSI